MKNHTCEVLKKISTFLWISFFFKYFYTQVCRKIKEQLIVTSTLAG